MEFRSKPDGSHFPLSGNSNSGAYDSMKGKQWPRPMKAGKNSLVTNEGIQKVLEYSENKEHLQRLLNDIDVSAKFVKYGPYFKDDRESRNIYRATIKRRGKKSISFPFGDSINNTQQGIKPDLYSILTIAGAEANTPEDFKEFIDEYGFSYENYNEYRKLKSQHNKSLAMTKKVKSIFSEEDIESLPH